jgi:hypothetical protein
VLGFQQKKSCPLRAFWQVPLKSDTQSSSACVNMDGNIFYALNMNKGSKHVFIVDTLLGVKWHKSEKMRARHTLPSISHSHTRAGVQVQMVTNWSIVVDDVTLAPFIQYYIPYTLRGENQPSTLARARYCFRIMFSRSHPMCRVRVRRRSLASSFAACVPAGDHTRCPTDGVSPARSTDLLSNAKATN